MINGFNRREAHRLLIILNKFHVNEFPLGFQTLQHNQPKNKLLFGVEDLFQTNLLQDTLGRVLKVSWKKSFMLYFPCEIQALGLSLIRHIFLRDQITVIGGLKTAQLPPFVQTPPCTHLTHNDSERLATCQDNLPTAVSFPLSIFLIPKPPTFFYLQTSFILILLGAVFVGFACYPI